MEQIITYCFNHFVTVIGTATVQVKYYNYYPNTVLHE